MWSVVIFNPRMRQLIAVDLNILQYDSWTFLSVILRDLDGFENAGSSTSKRFSAVWRYNICSAIPPWICLVILRMNSNDETFLVFWDALNGGVEAELLPAGKGEKAAKSSMKALGS